MHEGRFLKPGDKAVTNFNGRPAVVTITARRTGVARSQTGIQYRTQPLLRTYPDRGNPHDDWEPGLGSWYDADWFSPIV